ncbi:hypothetical protein HYH03_014679 [Edaphochlamys debaryana]|uniref:Tetratricopeptide repeat protein n=1 Tax=Edaphochlamys debaryana TaxID=47281 RepID=A0A835XNI5_9CHLO|nr:hypothetical protein HYH03_014679 [Edaphochlamys debaryana]|eukprot:KAG2486622.1 hypothetical protein HYH03_014679 [Edaphochlamys debaryana]
MQSLLQYQRGVLRPAQRGPIRGPSLAPSLRTTRPPSTVSASARQESTASCSQEPLVTGRRQALGAAVAVLAAVAFPAGFAARAADPALVATAVDLATIEEEALLAYAGQRFGDAVRLMTQAIAVEPRETRWREMRAQALVDGKNFPAAIDDFNTGLELAGTADPVLRARLLVGRALAREGLGEWEAALSDYKEGFILAAEAGESPDPYVLNSVGNCLNSLERWEEAREAYLTSSQLFQQARGFRGRNGGTTDRLDGAVFAASNAALMRAQMGDTDGALQEISRIARRAPGSADMRAALAALYWERGRRQEAEEAWEYACDRILVGCTKYGDMDWLSRVRRWPPAMVERMSAFLALR